MATKLDEVARTGRATKDATFKNRRERKAYRKSLRSMIANKIVDKGLDKSEKRKFYESLRLVKMRRRKLAQEMHAVVESLCALEREVNRVHTRVPASNPAYVDYAASMIRSAIKAADQTAADFEAFSRKPVLRYRTDGKVAA